MFGGQDFRQCVTDNLKAMRFGEKRGKEVLDYFDRRVREYKAEGTNSPYADALAMTDAMNEFTYRNREADKRAAKMLAVQASVTERILQGQRVRMVKIKGLAKGNVGVAMAQGAKSLIEQDPRFNGLDFVSVYHSYRDKYWALMGDVLDNFNKGAFGVQRGSAHLPNVVRELFGKDTGDKIAKQIATAYRKVQDTMVDDFNLAGGSLRKLVDFNMPQSQNAAKVIGAGSKQWIEDHMNWLDWNKMRWPDGNRIEPGERQAALMQAYTTLSQDGAVGMKESSVGRSSVGNSLDKHRFLVYKEGQSWLDMHAKYGDGNVFDVISRHVEQMAHKTALVQQFGPSPETMRQTIKNIVRKQAGIAARTADSLGNKKDVTAVADADAIMGNNKQFDAMFDMITHANHMDPHSIGGSIIHTTSNVLTSALLGSVPLLALPGDFLTTLNTRFINHMPLRDGIGLYLKTFTTPGAYGNMQNILARAGFVIDETVSSTYATERFNMISTYGANWSRRMGDLVMRTSMLTRHTNVSRGTAQLEFMGLLDEYKGAAYDDLPFKLVLERYGIDAKDWDAVRKLNSWSPNGGKANYLRPLDILNSGIGLKDERYRKFYSMIFTEARNMVPSSTLEASSVLRGSTRPDTLHGAILHSFAMYKNFPVTVMNQYARLALDNNSINRRVGFIAGLGVGSVAVGALGTQLREMARGKEPLPMDTGSFWGKALLAGGGLSIFGDFLFSGVNDFGRGAPNVMAGPIGQALQDTANLTFGDGFAWVKQFDGLGQFDSKFLPRTVEFARRNLPGSSVWWSRLVLEREVFDRLQAWADPKARQKWQRKIRRQKKDFGNTYYWEPGESMFGR